VELLLGRSIFDEVFEDSQSKLNRNLLPAKDKLIQFAGYEYCRANLGGKDQIVRDHPYWVHIKVLIHGSSRVQPD